jgi:sialic acid synthase SpsE/mannose-6-phosphate isomerase-like protein (cupin superfamily)
MSTFALAKSKIPKPLITFEMANNHMGDLQHGERIIGEFAKLCRSYPDFCFAFKLQYRNLDTFVHSSMKERYDVKHIKRFNETRLTRGQFDRLIEVIKQEGFTSMVTPFDEESVEIIQEQDVEIIKIASCSFNDWPLLERVALTNKPIIASTAGASLAALDAVVSFLSHRTKDFAILHCVAEYPAPDSRMELNQIDFLKQRYTGLRVGFSTHEDPDNSEIVKLAAAKGADIFEKHVGFPTDTYKLNAYSASPDQARRWLDSLAYAISACGHTAASRSPVNEAEQLSLLELRRGVFAARPVEPGVLLSRNDIYFAFPPIDGQLTANEWGKYVSFRTESGVGEGEPILHAAIKTRDDREKVRDVAQRVKQLLSKSHITIPGNVELEISHHYGIDRFDEVGLTMLTIVNRGYCKKLLVCLAGQRHPEQFHKQKEETFHVLYGDLELTLNGKASLRHPGDVINIEPGVRHAFVSQTGAIIEEISSTHFINDSFYTDESINANKHRKTLLTYWMD